MSLLRAFVATDNPQAIERLFYEYSELHEGVAPVRFLIVRRFLTVSLRKESIMATTARLNRIISLGNLDPQQIQLLQNMVHHPDSFTSLSIDQLPFQDALCCEALRLESDVHEIIRNTVSSFTLSNTIIPAVTALPLFHERSSS